MVANLSGWSWFGLVVYVVVMVFVIRPVRIPLPRGMSRALSRVLVSLRILDPSPADRSLSISLDLRTAPVTGVILLLITTAIPGSVLRAGIVGAGSISPYNVLVLFISLAYISTALDSTGGLRSLAFWIAKKSARAPEAVGDGGSEATVGAAGAGATADGRKLWAILYWFWFVAGVIVGNDPIVLSGTPFLCYFAEHVHLATSTAWTFSAFVAANVASAALVSSNPTNLLIANAFGLNFITGYTAFTILPCVITALAAFPLAFAVFTIAGPKGQPTPTAADNDGANADSPPKADPASLAFIPKQLSMPDVNPRDALLDPSGAIFHAALMLVTLAVLIGTTFVPHEAVEVWMVTAPAGVIAFGYDVVTEYYRGKKAKAASDDPKSAEKDTPSSDLKAEPVVPRPFVVERWSVPGVARAVQARFPTTSATVSRLPLPLLLFAGGIFVLVRALTHLGWTNIFACWLVHVATSPAKVAFFLGYIIALLCPVCGTNIGATILFVEIITDDAFKLSPRVVANPNILQAAIYSTALASNLGACGWSLSGSLAGLLWSSILRQKGTVVTEREFAKWNVWFLPVLSTVASAVVVMEVYCFPFLGFTGGGE